MGLPNVNIRQSNNNLGRVLANADGVAALIVSGVALSGQFALGEVIGPFLSLQDVEDIGIDAAYDSTNTCTAHLHIKDFYTEAGKGNKLYLMVVDKTITMTQMCDKANDYVKKLIEHDNNSIKLIGVTRTPNGAYTPNYVDQFDDDIWGAVAKAQELRNEMFDEPNYKITQILIEGRDWQGSVANSRNLRSTLDADRVSIVMAQNPATIEEYVWNQQYAAVGAALGSLAALPVQRNIGRVANGRTVGFVRAGYSNGEDFYTLSDTERELLDERGYISLRTFTDRVGFFWNDDHTCVAITSDYAYIGRGRTIDKASRLARYVLTEYVNDDIPVDNNTGKLPLSVIKQIQGNVESYVQQSMVDEISGVDCVIDPEQDIISTDELTMELDIVPKGIAKHIIVTVGYKNPNITQS